MEKTHVKGKIAYTIHIGIDKSGLNCPELKTKLVQLIPKNNKKILNNIKTMYLTKSILMWNFFSIYD